MFLFGKKGEDKEELSLIFDVSSSSVGGALVRYKKNKLPLILFSTRKNVEFKENFDFDFFYRSMLKSLEDVTIDVLSALSSSVEDVLDSLSGPKKRLITGRKRHAIKNIYCVFSAPWYTPIIIDLKREFDEDTLITPEVIWSLIREKIIEVKSQYDDPKSIGFIEEKILEYKLNGYLIEGPLSTKARVADAKLYLSSVYKQTISAAKDPIRKMFSYRKIQSFSFLLMFFTLMRDLHADDDSFVSLDFRGEVLEVGVVYDDVLVKSLTVPFGKNTLLRNVAKRLNISVFEVTSRFRLFLSGKLQADIQNSFGHVVEEELLAFERVVVNLMREEGISLPRRVYVLSDKDIEPISERVARFIYGDSPASDYEVVTLFDTYFEKYVHFAKSRYRDHFLAFEALYFMNVDNVGK